MNRAVNSCSPLLTSYFLVQLTLPAQGTMISQRLDEEGPPESAHGLLEFSGVVASREPVSSGRRSLAQAGVRDRVEDAGPLVDT